MDDIYYSVEFLHKTTKLEHWNCWNQFTVSRFGLLSKVYMWECKRRYGKDYVYRIREV